MPFDMDGSSPGSSRPSASEQSSKSRRRFTPLGLSAFSRTCFSCSSVTFACFFFFCFPLVCFLPAAVTFSSASLPTAAEAPLGSSMPFDMDGSSSSSISRRRFTPLGGSAFSHTSFSCSSSPASSWVTFACFFFFPLVCFLPAAVTFSSASS